MNPIEANSILSSKVKLCADASAAAGPKGHTATDTDIVMRTVVNNLGNKHIEALVRRYQDRWEVCLD